MFNLSFSQILLVRQLILPAFHI